MVAVAARGGSGDRPVRGSITSSRADDGQGRRHRRRRGGALTLVWMGVGDEESALAKDFHGGKERARGANLRGRKNQGLAPRGPGGVARSPGAAGFSVSGNPS